MMISMGIWIMKNKNLVKASVSIDLVMEATSTWADQITMAQIRDQASEEIIGRLRRVIEAGHLGKASFKGDPKVTAILVLEDERK